MGKILVIDDSQSMLRLVESILVPAGHEVIALSDPTKAYELMAQSRLDLILTDIYMPDRDGLEIIAGARKICPHVPVIAASSATGEKDMLRMARMMGAAGTLPKPFSSSDLLHSVSRVLGMASTVGVRPRGGVGG